MNKVVHKSTSNLPRLLSLLPKDGLNSIVYQTRWKGKGIPTPDSASNLAGASYWDVLLVKHSYNDAGKVTGKAYGVLYWKGELPSLLRVSSFDYLDLSLLLSRISFNSV
jgi:hypothetical protein